MIESFSRAGASMLVAAALFSGAACAAQAHDNPRQDRGTAAGFSPSLVGSSVSVGQGTYIVPATPVVSEAPYALTGPRYAEDRSTDRLQGRWVDVGQGRVFLPPSR